MKHISTILALIIGVSSTASTLAQSPSEEPSKDGQRIRKKVVGYGAGHRITVTLKGGTIYHGTVGLLDDTTFQVNEIDMNTVVSIKYDDVKKVQGDYGPKNIFGKRVNPRTSRIVVFSVLGGLAALIILSVPKT